VPKYIRFYGGWKALDELFDEEHGVKWALRANKRRMNFKNSAYKGTLIFHRLAVYAHAILHPDKDPWTVPTPQLADTCDYTAFVEAIKCSPNDGAMCAPIGEMQTKCLNAICCRKWRYLILTRQSFLTGLLLTCLAMEQCDRDCGDGREGFALHD
jgi:hypothetical protein